LYNTDIVLQQFPYIFDGFLEEILPALLSGATIVIPSYKDLINIEIFSQYIEKFEVSVISCTPLFINKLNQLSGNNEKFKRIRLIISGGDVLKKEHINQLIKFTNIINTYGPTQATISTTFYRCTKKLPIKIPIGKPLPSYGILILNKFKQIVPIGVYGEIHIGGLGLALGYIEDADIANEKFKYLPILPNQRLYETSDMGRWLENGELEFCGRIPNETGIIGLQMFNENTDMLLSSIENCLCNYKQIRAATAIINKTHYKGDIIVVYFIASISLSFEILSAYLAKTTSFTNLPISFKQVVEYPSDRNGKLCRKTLALLE